MPRRRRRLRAVGRGYREIRQSFPRRGWVEHDPEEIWASVEQTAADALGAAGIRASRPGGDRDHEPARDDGRLGAGHRRDRCIRRSCGRTGGRPSGARRSRRADPPAHRARPRPVLLGHEARVDPRAHRGPGRPSWRSGRSIVARLEADRRRGARHRRHERVADDAPRPRIGSLGRRAARAVRRRPRGAPDGRGLVGRRRRGVAPRRPRAGGRDRGRPAGSALRTGLLRAGGGEGDVRDGDVRARRPRRGSRRTGRRAAHHRRSGRAGRRGAVSQPRVRSSSAAQRCSGSATGSA